MLLLPLTTIWAALTVYEAAAEFPVLAVYGVVLIVAVSVAKLIGMACWVHDPGRRWGMAVAIAGGLLTWALSTYRLASGWPVGTGDVIQAALGVAVVELTGLVLPLVLLLFLYPPAPPLRASPSRRRASA
jgi:hypothetical protein